MTLDLKELLDTSVILFPDELLRYYFKKEELEEVKKQIQQMNSNSQHILERKASNNVE